MRYAVVEVTTSGDTVIIPALPGKVVRVFDYLITSNNNTDIVWKSSGGTPVSGTLYAGVHSSMTAVGGYQLPSGMFGLFETLPNEGLILSNSSIGASVGGHLTYNYIAV